MVKITKQLDGKFEVATQYQDGYDRAYFDTFDEAREGIEHYIFVDLTKNPIIHVALNGEAFVEDYQLRRATLLAIHKRRERLQADSQYELIVTFRKKT